MVKHPYKKVFIALPAACFCLSLSLQLTRNGWAQSPVEPKTQTTVPTLVNALNDKDWRVRSQAANRLGQMGAIASVAIPDLIKSLDDEDVVVRLRAALALGKIGKPAVPALITALRDQNEQVRYNATYALARVGSVAIPALTEALKDRDERVRNAAISALGQISGELQDKGKTLPLAELNKAISDLEQVTSVLTASNLNDGISGTPKIAAGFSDEQIAPVRRGLETLPCLLTLDG
jgi:HEAT repeat protein